MMMFHERIFRPALHACVRKHLRNVKAETIGKTACWQLLAEHPDDVQREIERAYKAYQLQVHSPEELRPRLGTLGDLVSWMAANWTVILQILIALLPLILDDDMTAERIEPTA
jgi:hypothetical protein